MKKQRIALMVLLVSLLFVNLSVWGVNYQALCRVAIKENFWLFKKVVGVGFLVAPDTVITSAFVLMKTEYPGFYDPQRVVCIFGDKITGEEYVRVRSYILDTALSVVKLCIPKTERIPFRVGRLKLAYGEKDILTVVTYDEEIGCWVRIPTLAMGTSRREVPKMLAVEGGPDRLLQGIQGSPVFQGERVVGVVQYQEVIDPFCRGFLVYTLCVRKAHKGIEVK